MTKILRGGILPGKTGVDRVRVGIPRCGREHASERREGGSVDWELGEGATNMPPDRFSHISPTAVLLETKVDEKVAGQDEAGIPLAVDGGLEAVRGRRGRREEYENMCPHYFWSRNSILFR